MFPRCDNEMKRNKKEFYMIDTFRNLKKAISKRSQNI